MPSNSPQLQQSRRQALRCAQNHYENFPVAPRLLFDSNRRYAVAAIYRFAREADDIADELTLPAAQRLQQLTLFEQQFLAQLQQNTPPTPRFAALIAAIEAFNLNPQWLLDLLHAFKQDCTQQRYADMAAVMAYCRYSANPVGRLLLELHQITHPAAITASDSLCSALQLLNFLQDLAQDWHENRRLYLPCNSYSSLG